MDIGEIENILKKFQWEKLQRMYGCAHSSIIGFISTEWIRFSLKDNSILDGAPSPKIGKGRKGQTNADILLCKVDKPLIPVEVETNVLKYEKKLKSLFDYLDNNKNFEGIEFGLLVMLNLCSGDKNHQHNWESIKQIVQENGKSNIALVSIIKEKPELKDSVLNELRGRNNYFPWDIIQIDYWIFGANQQREGTLWSK